MCNGKVFFSAYDTSGNQGLWVSDGTSSGTHELTGIANAYTGPGGFEPSGFVAYNGEMLFSGADASGAHGLWITDGTAAGTMHEIPGSSGLNPSSLTALTPVSATAPTLSITSAALASNQTTVTLTGTIDAAEAGLTISIYDGTTLLGTATANSSGSGRPTSPFPRRACTR